MDGETITFYIKDMYLTTGIMGAVTGGLAKVEWPTTITVPRTWSPGVYQVKAIYKYNESLTCTASTGFYVCWRTRASWINYPKSAYLYETKTYEFKLEKYNEIIGEWEPLPNVVVEIVIRDPTGYRWSMYIYTDSNGIGSFKLSFNKVGTYYVFGVFHGVEGHIVGLPRYPYLYCTLTSISTTVSSPPSSSTSTTSAATSTTSVPATSISTTAASMPTMDLSPMLMLMAILMLLALPLMLLAALK